jgi:hypothetical protein
MFLLLACMPALPIEAPTATPGVLDTQPQDTGELRLCTVWWDGDHDGYGAGESAEQPCQHIEQGWVDRDEDCDDANPLIAPDQTEICNGVDDDCDDAVDLDDPDLDPSTLSTWYPDGDDDGFGDPDGAMALCDQPADTVADGTDCDDANDAVNPGATEICNGIDDDCDTYADDPTVCPCGLQRHSGHVYLFCLETRDWEEALAECEKLDNYSLVVINDATEQDFVRNAGQAVQSGSWWWLGYHDRNGSYSEEPGSAWEWVDGSTSGYTNWASGQPDNYWGEDCAHMYDDGRWNDLDCDSNSWDDDDVSVVCESTVPG